MKRSNRRGVMSLAFAVSVLLLMGMLLWAYTLTISCAGLKCEQAQKATQALYAAEAGLDVAAQSTGDGTIEGRAGASRYVARRTGSQIVSVGETPRAFGNPARAAVTVTVGAAGVVPGSWRQVPPLSYASLFEWKKP